MTTITISRTKAAKTILHRSLRNPTPKSAKSDDQWKSILVDSLGILTLTVLWVLFYFLL